MITTQAPAHPAHLDRMEVTDDGGIVMRTRLVTYLACTLAVVACNYVLGKDMPWDTLHYHVYAGFSALHDRFEQDYFAAGPQAYFNPYAYVPLYWMVSAGLSGIVICGVLAAVQSSILWLTYELGILVSRHAGRRRSHWLGITAVCLALANPVLLQQIGSSFADISTAILVLGGWLVLIRGIGCWNAPRPSHLFAGGLLLGLASALKLTNAPYAIAAMALVVVPAKSWRYALRDLAWFGLWGAVGFLLVAAPWGLKLWKHFGNPLFPLFNGIFHSPYFTTQSLRHDRFLSDSLSQALWRPFAMVDPTRLIHEELRSPDVRYAALILLGALLALTVVLRSMRSRISSPEHGAHVPELAGPRVVSALAWGFILAWGLWLMTSANSRYFIPMSSIASVLLATVLQRLQAVQNRLFAYGLALTLALQGAELWLGAELRWNPVPWSGPWLDVSVPRELRTEPTLFLTVGVQSNSFVAPYLAPESGLINFSGGYPLGPHGAEGEKIRRLIARYAPHLKVLVQGYRIYPPDEMQQPTRAGLDSVSERFDLRVDQTDCERIAVPGLGIVPRITVAAVKVKDEGVKDEGVAGMTYLLSCRLTESNVDRSVLIGRQKVVDEIFDRIEDACPRLFQPRRPITERQTGIWERFYVNTDIKAWIGEGWVNFYDPVRGDDSVAIGREAEWLEGHPKLTCGRRDGHYFASMVSPQPGH